MRTNVVGRSCVSAITHTPKGSPLGPVTTPAMSWAPTGTPWASKGRAATVESPIIAAPMHPSRIVLIVPLFCFLEFLDLPPHPLSGRTALSPPSPEGRGGQGVRTDRETGTGGEDYTHERKRSLTNGSSVSSGILHTASLKISTSMGPA